VAFHVEIRNGSQHARVFNLDVLRGRVLVPWLEERTIDLGDQVWDPRASRLTVLEGAALDAPDLAVGQGWSNALRRRSHDVTVAALEAVRNRAAATSPERAPAAPPVVGVTILAAPSDAAQAKAAELASELGLRPEPWGVVRARLVAGAAVVRARPTPAVAVLVVLDGEPDAATAFDLGLALGAFGGAVVVATIAPGAPGAVATVDLGDPDAGVVVAERLRLAGALPD
jgi:hypothetical protein